MVKFNPVVNSGELTYLNPEGDIAYCCLWTKQDHAVQELKKYMKGEDFSRIAVVGNLYDPCGVANILRNLRANTHIKTLYVIGNDLTGLVQWIKKDWVDGIDLETIGQDEPIRIVPEWVSLYIATLKFSETHEISVDQFIPAKSSPPPPRVIPPKDVFCDRYEVPYSGVLLAGSDIYEAWSQAKYHIQSFGKEHESRYGTIYEILSLSTVVKETGSIKKFPDHISSEMSNYLENLQETSVPEGISYTYGQKLGGIYEFIPDKVRTREAFWPIYHPGDREIDMPPCFVSAWFKERNGYLIGIYSFRSHDFHKGYPINVYGLRGIQEELAKRCDLGCGESVTHSFSAHIYKRDYDESFCYQEVMDRAGNFIFLVEQNEILVSLSRSGRIVQSFKGTSAEELTDYLAPYITSTSHAIYVGRQLQLAEERFKSLKGE